MAIRPLSAELQRKSKNELNEVPERIQEDLQQLRDWLQKQHHLSARNDDQWLIGFLRGCKFSLQRTKEKIDYFYTMKTLIPEIFNDRNPFLPEIQEILSAGVVIPLPQTKGSSNPRIVLFRFQVCNIDTMTLLNITKVYFMIMDILMNEDDNCMIAGKYMLADYKDFALSYMLQFTPNLTQKVIHCLQTGYPIRIKGIYCANAPAVFETIFNLIKKFLSEKLKKRMHMYGENNFDKVYDTIPQSYFPIEYGGVNGSIEELTVSWKKKVESYESWFKEDSKYRSDEKLRPGRPKTFDDEFGVEGTFRKLAVD